jgi:hypothetical protein
MSLLIGIAQYLSDNIQAAGFEQSQSSSYPSAGTLFGIYILALPESPDTGISLTLYPGPDSTPKLGHDTPNLQARVRGTREPRTAMGMAQGVYNQLHGLTETLLSEGTYVTTCVGLNSGPVYIGRDANGRHEFTVNFRLQVRNATVHRETPV